MSYDRDARSASALRDLLEHPIDDPICCMMLADPTPFGHQEAPQLTNPHKILERYIWGELRTGNRRLFLQAHTFQTIPA
jgi:hypothetical protein